MSVGSADMLNRRGITTTALRSLLTCILGMLTATALSSAQIVVDSSWDGELHPELWVTIEDSNTILLLRPGGDTTDPLDVAAQLGFYMSYDSLCLVEYMITEFRNNRTRIPLSTWKEGSFVNAPTSYLNANNCTDTFTVHHGDTISFYREFGLMNPLTRLQDTNNFYSLDTLDYSVELVRRSDSTVVALLDSIGVLPRTQIGRPAVHGSRPLMARANYRIPPALEGEQVYIRVRLYHRGPGPYWFSREDEIGIGISKRLDNPIWQEYLAMTGGLFARYAPSELERATGDDPRLAVRYVRGDPSVVEIRFTPPEGDAASSIGVYDINGALLYLPFMASAASGEQRVRHRFAAPGVYFVACFADGVLVRSHKVVISE